MSMTLARPLRAALIAALSALALAACDNAANVDVSATTPAAGNPPPAAVPPGGTVPAAAGGTVTVPANAPLAGSSITVPPRALAADTRIGIAPSDTAAPAGSIGTVVDFTPSGTQFAQPARISIGYNPAQITAGFDESDVAIAKIEADGTLTALADIRVDADANRVSGLTSTFSDFVAVLPNADGLVGYAPFTLQLLHAGDPEAGVEATADAPRFSSVLTSLRAIAPEISLTLSSGDNYIPGPFFATGGDPALDDVLSDARPGRADIEIINAMGFQASAFGNHEFDTGTGTIEDLIGIETESDGSVYPGTTFPYLSTNLDFTNEGDLNGFVVPDGQPAAPNSIAGSVTIEVDGQTIGVVGATTPTLADIAAPGDNIGISPIQFDENSAQDIAALAAAIQPAVDALASAGVNKIVLLAHMQRISIERQLAELLTGVDIIVAGGSNTILADSNDRLRAGDSASGTYPELYTSAAGEPVALVNTDGNYRYVGRLMVGFDDAGVLVSDSVSARISGAFATDDQGVIDAGNAAPDARVVEIADAVNAQIMAKDGNVFGLSEVYLNGVRGSVRTEETNLGNLTADANLAVAQNVDDTVLLSIKNGGGIRADIGQVSVPPGSSSADDVQLLPTAANPGAGKEAGEISQLDIENALRFNNGLTLLTATATELKDIFEHAVSGSGPDSTPGRFPQISGVRFSFDVTGAARMADMPGTGARIVNLVIVDDNGTLIDTVVQDGQIVGDPARTFRFVTLSFLADGGDGYPFDTLANPDRVDLSDVAMGDGAATFSPPGREQDALAEFLAANFPADDDPATPAFADADQDAADDVRIQDLARVPADTVIPPFRLQLLHAADFEGAGPAIDDAPRFSAVLSALEDEFANTIKLLSGDNYIPGAFFSASGTSDFAAALSLPDSGQGGRGDILIANAMGFQASSLGNHEFDRGTDDVAALISSNVDEGLMYPGANFPYLSANLDFSADANLSGLVVDDGAAPQPNSLAASTIITVGGQQIGVVGATTPTLPEISSPGDVVVSPMDFDGSSMAVAALADDIQPAVDTLTAQGVNKIILLAHMQVLDVERQLASLLDGVDVIVAGGSNSILADSNDTLRAGDTAVDTYPISGTSASGEPVLVVNTGGSYRYLGRLVLDFTPAGVIDLSSLDDTINGAYATDAAGVTAVGNPAPNADVQAVVDAIADVLIARESNILGNTAVFLEGRRAPGVRTEETNLGNLTADANLAAAQVVVPTAALSLKNGGGIRAPIGEVVQPAGSTDPSQVETRPPAAIPAAGKAEGDISQFDIETTLAFNNGLVVITVTATELKRLMEHGLGFDGVADPASPDGQFPQIGGMVVEFDPAATGAQGAMAETGQRIRTLVVTDNNGAAIGGSADTVVENGVIVGDPNRTFDLVTLDFLFNNDGDGYPFSSLAAPNPVFLEDAMTAIGGQTFADDGSEQDALADFLLTNFPDAANPFSLDDTAPADDRRLVNLSASTDTVIFSGMDGGQENPPVVTDSLAFGTTSIDADALTISAEVVARGFVPTMVHLHAGFAGENGPVIIGLDQDPTTPERYTVEDAPITQAQLDTILDGGWYLNAHSTANPSGEVRGQIVPEGFAVTHFALSGDQEVPPVMTDSTGFSAATVNLTTGGIVLFAQSDVPSSTMAHIHQGAAGSNGPVIIGLTRDPDNMDRWFTPEGSTLSMDASSGESQFDAFIDGNLYVNIHSQANPGGEVRGQFGQD